MRWMQNIGMFNHTYKQRHTDKAHTNETKIYSETLCATEGYASYSVVVDIYEVLRNLAFISLVSMQFPTAEYYDSVDLKF